MGDFLAFLWGLDFCEGCSFVCFIRFSGKFSAWCSNSAEVFAIAFTQVAVDTAAGAAYYSSLPQASCTPPKLIRIILSLEYPKNPCMNYLPVHTYTYIDIILKKHTHIRIHIYMICIPCIHVWQTWTFHVGKCIAIHRWYGKWFAFFETGCFHLRCGMWLQAMFSLIFNGCFNNNLVDMARLSFQAWRGCTLYREALPTFSMVTLPKKVFILMVGDEW